MEETCCGYCLARDIAMPYSPLSLLQVVAVAEMAAVSSAMLQPRLLTYRRIKSELLKQFYTLCSTAVYTVALPRILDQVKKFLIKHSRVNFIEPVML